MSAILRAFYIRARASQPRFGLGNIRSGNFADFETVAGCFPLSAKNLFVVDIQLDDRLIAHNIHKGRSRIQKHFCLDEAQACALGLHAIFRLARFIKGPATTEDGLRKEDAHTRGGTNLGARRLGE